MGEPDVAIRDAAAWWKEEKKIQFLKSKRVGRRWRPVLPAGSATAQMLSPGPAIL